MLHGKLINRWHPQGRTFMPRCAQSVKTDGVLTPGEVSRPAISSKSVGYQVASIAIGPDPDEMVLRSQRTPFVR